jgi:hypothetical protein
MMQQRSSRTAMNIGGLMLAVFMLAAAVAGEALTPSPEMQWFTVDAGGGVMAGNGFVLTGTIGQMDAALPMVGVSGGGDNLAFSAGFWQGVAPFTCHAGGGPVLPVIVASAPPDTSPCTNCVELTKTPVPPSDALSSWSSVKSPSSLTVPGPPHVKPTNASAVPSAFCGLSGVVPVSESSAELSIESSPHAPPTGGGTTTSTATVRPPTATPIVVSVPSASLANTEPV